MNSYISGVSCSFWRCTKCRNELLPKKALRDQFQIWKLQRICSALQNLLRSVGGRQSLIHPPRLYLVALRQFCLQEQLHGNYRVGEKGFLNSLNLWTPIFTLHQHSTPQLSRFAWISDSDHSRFQGKMNFFFLPLTSSSWKSGISELRNKFSGSVLVENSGSCGPKGIRSWAGGVLEPRMKIWICGHQTEIKAKIKEQGLGFFMCSCGGFFLSAGKFQARNC